MHAALGAVVLLPSQARAQESEGFALNRFEPSERGSEWFVSDSLDFRGHGRPALGLVLDWGHRPLVFREDDGTSETFVQRQIFAHFGGSLVLWERLRLSGSLPVLLRQSGEDLVIDGTNYAAPSGSAAGDLRLTADLRILGEYRSPFSLAAGVRAWLPTGDRASYTGDGKARVGGQLLVAGEIGSFVYAARAGVNYRALQESFAGSPLGTEVSFGASGGVRVLDGALVVGPELFGSTVVVDGGAFDRQSTPLEVLLGGHYTAGPWRFGAGVGPGLTRGFGSPAFRGLLSVEYIPVIEAPVREAQSEPHCPTPPDSDGDGIEDSVDACPGVPGVPHADPARHGCPPPTDSDGDGIPDAEDACPNEAGPQNADPELNGCPPPPPPDTDGDGIIDAQDACPNEAGSASEDPARHGCPQVVVSGSRIELLEKVQFELGSSEILGESHQLLKDVARAIKTLPAGTRIRVEGHTDSRGRKELNQQLSQARAASVVTWLVANEGVPVERLSAVGFGDTKPLSGNDTEEGRQANRRVEFHIVEDQSGDAGSADTWK